MDASYIACFFLVFPGMIKARYARLDGAPPENPNKTTRGFVVKKSRLCQYIYHLYSAEKGGLYATYHLLREPETTIDFGKKTSHGFSSWPLVGNEGMNPQYTNVKVDSLIPY